MIRRPLCLFAILHAAVTALLLTVSVPEGSTALPDRMTVTITGIVTEKQIKTNAEQKQIILQIKNAAFAGSESSAKNNDIQEVDIQNTGILCYFEDTRMPRMGSTVSIKGRLQIIPGATNPGEFDARSYYLCRGITCRMYECQILEESADYSRWREGMYRFREACSSVLLQVLPEKEASIMRAMLLGDKADLDPEIKKQYQRNAISHILAISGLHITMIGMGTCQLLRRILPGRAAAVVSAVILLAYGSMVGFGTSTLRAVLMFLLQLAAGQIGRTYDTATGLAAAGIVILAGQPLYLLDGGFQLSFTAVIGACVTAPFLMSVTPRIPGSRYAEGGGVGFRPGAALCRLPVGIRKAFLFNLAISLTTLPVMLYHFYEFSLLSIFLNLLVIPLMGILLFFTICVIGAGFIYLPAAVLLSVPVRLLLAFYEGACTVMDQIRFGRVRTGCISVGQAAVFYLLLFGAVLAGRRLPDLCRSVLPIVGCLILFFRWQPGPQITMLDIGQGDCSYVRTAAGNHYLIDGGSSSEKKAGEYKIIPFLKYQGVKVLEGVFISHADEDHVNGIRQLMELSVQEDIRIRTLFLPDTTGEDQALQELAGVAESRSIPVKYLKQGERLTDGTTIFSCLHPCPEDTELDRNEASMVLLVGQKDMHTLFTGDIGFPAENHLINQVQTHLQKTGESGFHLLKAAHHGSKTSGRSDFLDLFRPDLTLISCAERNSYGHPAKEVLGRLRQVNSRVLITKDCGSITVRWKHRRVTVQPFRPPGS